MLKKTLIDNLIAKLEKDRFHLTKEKYLFHYLSVDITKGAKGNLPQRKLLQEIESKLSLDIALPSILRSTVFEDNNGALQLSKELFQDKIGEEKGIVIEKVDSIDQLADLFTKVLQIQLFKPLQERLMVW